MGMKSTVGTLPKVLEHALNQRIIEGKHSAIELNDWLSQQGHCLGTNAISDYSRAVKRIVKDSDTLRLRFNLSPATLAMHLKDLDTLAALIITKFVTDEHISAIEYALIIAEHDHKALNQGGE